jgi:hypothetical protein
VAIIRRQTDRIINLLEFMVSPLNWRPNGAAFLPQEWH